MKTCVQCEFRKRQKDRTLCSTCISQNNREKHKIRFIYKDLKWSAIRRGIEFLITWDEFLKWIQTEDGQKYLHHRGRNLDDLTIDRKEEGSAYTIDGIQVITKRENIKKFNKYYSDLQKSHYDWSDVPF